ncbi:type II toxin-antitoxin system VapC family toxin [Jiella sonneratiae]|uniref:PIN domain-containing protein n=1 Tax=Jiella sonneratiae TaxID=2816856 RepID=A0ABS3J9K8_9HYPH|nr:PIN domain-containing protein [Jiella sonneratiae]MBO0906364.1 PIN domain-containing protein [Jiella sonneratiae]
MDNPPVYLDTNVLIALAEPVRPLTAPQSGFVESLDHGTRIAVTSEISLSECLVKPLADGQVGTVQAYFSMFTDQSWLQVLPVTRSVLIEAAQVRTLHRMALPDAIHVASARLVRCQSFLSDDKRLKTVGVSKISWSQFPQTL